LKLVNVTIHYLFRHWLDMRAASIIMCSNLQGSCRGLQCMLCLLSAHRTLTVLSHLSSAKDCSGFVCFVKFS